MFKTTMTGSFYRTKEIVELLGKSKTGEVSEKNSKEIEAAEKLAISDQIHPVYSSFCSMAGNSNAFVSSITFAINGFASINSA